MQAAADVESAPAPGDNPVEAEPEVETAEAAKPGCCQKCQASGTACYDRAFPPKSRRRGCLRCCCCFLLVLAVLECLFLLCLAFASIGVDLRGEQCAMVDYSPSDIDQALVMGTQSNVIGTSWYQDPAAGYDLTGLWWIKWEDETASIRAYNSMKLEMAVSFAGARQYIGDQQVVPAQPIFPSQLRVYALRTHHWCYSNSYPALWTMLSHALWYTASENGLHDGFFIFNFENKTIGEVQTQGPFRNIDADQWLRMNKMRDGGEANYKLTRIVYADGTRHPVYWKQWVDSMPPYKIRVWGSDSKCRRRCEVILSLFGASPFLSCRVCYRSCR